MTAKIIQIGPFLPQSESIQVDIIKFRDGEFAYQIHAEDTEENRTFYAACFALAAQDLIKDQL